MQLGKEIAISYRRKFKPTVFDSGIGARLPAAYRKFYDEWRNTTPQAVHYVPHEGNPWVRNDETGEVKRVENIPLPLLYPKELNRVITGGEAVIQGFTKKRMYSTRVARFWVPRVFRSVIYSEILDKYLSTMMTKRVIELIVKHQGLDSYLLETKACDLGTLLPIKLKQRLLLALSNYELPYDEEKNKEIYKKYEKYLIPPEEIEWYGLNFTEACSKLKAIEEAEKLAAIVPLKQVYRAQLLEELKEEQNNPPVVDEPVKIKKGPLNWFQKLPGKN